MKIININKSRRTSFADYFWLNRSMLEFCGVLPVPERSIVLTFFLTSLTFVSCIFLVFPGLYNIILNGDDIDATEKVNIIGESLEIFAGAVKVIGLLPFRSTILSLSLRATRLWQLINKDDDLKVVEPYARRGLLFTYGFGGNVFFALVSLVVSPLFTRNDDEYDDVNGTIILGRSLPYSAGILHEDKRLFNLWWALQAPAGFVGMIPIIGIDTSIGVFVLHGCAHLRLLRVKFRAAARDKRPSFSSVSTSMGAKIKYSDTRNEIVKCIDTHREIIRYCEEIEYSFRLVVLIQMILSIIAICGFGFNLLTQEKGRIKYGLHLFGAAIQLLIFCWPPDNLQDESTNIGHEAFNLTWYDWMKKDKCLAEFIITRSQKPLILTAGKFTVMSLQTFSSVLSTAFSFFSILRKTL